MRVGFDAHMVGQRETGNETYALGLLQGLDQIGFPVHTYAFADLPAGIHRPHRIRRYPSPLRVPLAVPYVAVRDRLDLWHGTYILPPFLPCKSVVTVHDITFALHSEWFPSHVHRMLRALVPLSMRRASRIIAISKRTKWDIVERYGLAPEKIAVTYLAPRPSLLSAPAAKTDQREPFFLYVGNVNPRKNVETLIRAVRIVKDRGLVVPLVLAGQPGFGFGRVADLIGELGLDDLVRVEGYVPDDKMTRLYASCAALVHPALYEGFGLTLLEAMAHGAPVIVADTSTAQEVVGDAALRVPPHDSEAWADALARIIHDADLRRSLSARGLAHARCFSWEKCARETVDVYRAVVEDPALSRTENPG